MRRTLSTLLISAAFGLAACSPTPPSTQQQVTLPTIEKKCHYSSVRCVLQLSGTRYMHTIPCERLNEKGILTGDRVQLDQESASSEYYVLKGCKGESMLYSNFDEASPDRWGKKVVNL